MVAYRSQSGCVRLYSRFGELILREDSPDPAALIWWALPALIPRYDGAQWF